MDTLTHIVAGAAIGEALLGKKAGKKAMFWGAVAANAPDIDAAMNFFISDVDALVMHRGITHSIFMALIFGPLSGWLLWKFYKEKVGTFRDWGLLFTVNILFHLFLDTCTVYGTGLLTPFTDHRYAFDNIFVADPLYTLPLLAGFIALLILNSKSPKRRNWNIFGLGLSSLYMIFTFYNHHCAMHALELSVNEKKIQATGFQVVPTLMNNVLWNVIAKDSAGYWMGYYSIFDHDPTPELLYFPANDELLNQISQSSDIQKLKVFSLGYYTVSVSENKIWFNILRFGQIDGWQNPNSNFAFSYNLTPGSDNSMVVQAGRIQGSKSEIVRSMFERMKGN